MIDKMRTIGVFAAVILAAAAVILAAAALIFVIKANNTPPPEPFPPSESEPSVTTPAPALSDDKPDLPDIPGYTIYPFADVDMRLPFISADGLEFEKAFVFGGFRVAMDENGRRIKNALNNFIKEEYPDEYERFLPYEKYIGGGLESLSDGGENLLSPLSKNKFVSAFSCLRVMLEADRTVVYNLNYGGLFASDVPENGYIETLPLAYAASLFVDYSRPDMKAVPELSKSGEYMFFLNENTGDFSVVFANTDERERGYTFRVAHNPKSASLIYSRRYSYEPGDEPEELALYEDAFFATELFEERDNPDDEKETPPTIFSVFVPPNSMLAISTLNVVPTLPDPWEVENVYHYRNEPVEDAYAETDDNTEEEN